MLLLFAAALTLTGCQNKEAQENGGTKIVLTTGFADNEIFRIDKSSCTVPEVMVYLMNTKNQYEEIFGEEIWNTSHEGMTLEENIKETVLAKIAKIKAMNLLAQQEGIILSVEEKQRTRKAAEVYYASLNDTEIEQLAVTEELIISMYEEYALAEKVYEHLIADINPEISDDEATGSDSGRKNAWNPQDAAPWIATHVRHVWRDNFSTNSGKCLLRGRRTFDSGNLDLCRARNFIFPSLL